MKCIHLFNGIGGFALAAQWMGWENVASCEIDTFCNKVTGYYWPNMKQHGDIKRTDFTIYRGAIDILTGGFPCQPFSMAGQRKGTEDERHLWPEMFRSIREIQPRYIVGENVPGFLNWNDGVVFEQVLSDLESEGYEVQPVVLPACAVNAPHRRDRVWIVANRTGEGLERGIGRSSERQGFAINSNGPTTYPTCQQDKRRGQGRFLPEPSGANVERNVADTTSERMEGNGTDRQQVTHPHAREGLLMCGGATGVPNWNNFPTQPPVCSRNDGIPTRLDGITFPKQRSESIKAYGNAIVPQIAYQIFKAIAATL